MNTKSQLRVLSCILIISLSWINAAFSDCTLTTTATTPLNDLGPGIYKGYEGGLYPNGADTPPPSHLAAGINLANQVTPLNASGVADPINGKIVMVSIGM